MFRRGLLQTHASIFEAILHIFDPLLIILAAWLSYFYVRNSWKLSDNYLLIALLTALLVIILFPAFRLYQSRRGESVGAELRMLLAAWGTVFIVLQLVNVTTKNTVQFSREWIGYWGLTGAGLLILSRVILRYTLRWLRSQGFNQRPIVIVGTGELATQVAKRLRESLWIGLEVIGFFDDDPIEASPSLVESQSLGNIDQLVDYINSHPVHQVWLAIPWSRQEKIDHVLKKLRNSMVEVRMVPDIFGYRLLNSSLSEVAGIPLLNLSVSPMHGFNRLIKALEDRILALLILAFVSPLMIAIAIGVKRSSPGPVFYRQRRVGFNNQPFMMLKFRSMPVDAETGSGPIWASVDDNRATRFGAFLRKTSLDELPQFINVLKGEMSIVGPRPERPVFVETFKDQVHGYMRKHMVKAGITGWAQVNGWRGNTDLQKRIEYDLYYIENWSLWFDLKIIFLTIFKGFIHKNAY